MPTVTDTEAAHAWAKHLGFDLDDIRTWTVGQLVCSLIDSRGRYIPIPQFVVRTLADLERQDTP